METSGHYCLDPSVWRSPGGQTLIGGSDFTIVGLDESQRNMLDQLLSGSDPTLPVPDAFVRFLCDRNLVQPIAEPTDHPEIALVIPCQNHQPELNGLLTELDLSQFHEIVVVDDGSATPLAVMPSAVRIIRHSTPLGSAAARNTGWRATTSEFVLFLDADVHTDGSWVSAAASYLNCPRVAAVAPRVRSIPAHNRAGRWEQARPALDLGTQRSGVRPRTRVPYVPTAALIVRRDALEAVGGFGPAMALGEDVDLVWRLNDRNLIVRYEPEFEVGHLPRPTIAAWLSQRVTYGRSNVALAGTHPGHVAGIELTWWNSAPLLVLARSRVFAIFGIALGFAGLVLLRDRLSDRCGNPGKMALRLQRDGIAYAADGVAQAARRNYWPLACMAAVCSRRGRWVLLASLITPSLEWFRRGRTIAFHEWMAASLADDVSFGAGLWFQSIRSRSARALRVHFSPLERFVPDPPSVSRRQSH